MMHPRPIRVKSAAIRASARGQDCTVRGPDCLGSPETVVLAHLRGPWALGAATKPHDFFGVYACHACHDAIDARRGERIPAGELLRALYETQTALAQAGLLKVRGED